MKKNDFKRGLLHGLPICFGYLAVAFSFGIFAVGQGLSVAEVIMISMTNVTSAGQLAGVPVIAGAGSLIELASTQLIINLRYALMSVSLSQKMDGSVRGVDRLLIAFVNTDEVFAVSAIQPHGVSRWYLYGLILTPYLGWAAGTALGAVAGNILPAIVSSALGVAIYGMFVAIVVPGMRDHRPTLFCVLTAIALSLLFYYTPGLKEVPSGFVIIICAVLASTLFALLSPIDKAQKEKEEGVGEP